MTLEVTRSGEASREIEVELGPHPDDEQTAYLGVRYVPFPHIEGLPEGIVPFEEFEFEDVSGESRTIRAHVDVAYQETGGSYHFHGDVTGAFATPCHMCGEPLEHRLGGEFDVVVRRSSDPAARSARTSLGRRGSAPRAREEELLPLQPEAVPRYV